MKKTLIIIIVLVVVIVGGYVVYDQFLDRGEEKEPNNTIRTEQNSNAPTNQNSITVSNSNTKTTISMDIAELSDKPSGAEDSTTDVSSTTGASDEVLLDLINNPEPDTPSSSNQIYTNEEYDFSFEYPKDNIGGPTYERSFVSPILSQTIYIQNYEGESSFFGLKRKGNYLIEVYIQKLFRGDSCERGLKDTVVTSFGIRSGILGTPTQRAGERSIGCVEMGDKIITITVTELDAESPVADIVFDSWAFTELVASIATIDYTVVSPLLSDITPDMFEIDTDGDTLSDGIERLHNSNIIVKDTDSDGYDDAAEILRCYNPNGEGSLGIDDFLAYCEAVIPLSTWEGTEYMDPSLAKQTCLLYKESGEIIIRGRNEGMGYDQIYGELKNAIDFWGLCGDLKTLHNTEEDPCGAMNFITNSFCNPWRFEHLI